MKNFKRKKIYQHLDDLETVDKIIQDGGDINRVYRKTKEHALFFALKKEVSIEVMELLLKAGIDVNMQNKAGNSVVHLCEDMDKLKMLLSYGADVNLINKASHTPIFNCVDYDKAKLLVDSGADLNAKDAEGKHFLKTLHVSDFDLMKLFIDKGMNRFMEKNGLTLDAFFETWSSREVHAYYENKLKMQPDLYRVKV